MSVRSMNKVHTPSNAPPLRFPQKLWKIANECQTGAVTWSPHGHSILVNYSLFKEEFMSMKNEFFKTDNISSFVRQLNLYGFRKVYDHTDKQGYKTYADLHEFTNLYFQRNRPELLEKVIRKSGILKDKNNNFPENQDCLDFDTDTCSEPICDDDPSVQISLPEIKPEDDKENIPPSIGTQPTYNAEETTAKKQKRKYKRANKSLYPLSKFPAKPRKEQLVTLKRPDPSLIFFDDDDDYPYLRNTSRDVMMSSTLPFQESLEVQELREAYFKSHPDTSQRAFLPLNIVKINKILPRI